MWKQKFKETLLHTLYSQLHMISLYTIGLISFGKISKNHKILLDLENK